MNLEPEKLLRLSNEPYIHIHEVEIHNILIDNCCEFMDELAQFYQHGPAEKEGTTTMQLPVKQVFSQVGYAGDFRIMPCVIDSLQLKMVKIIGTNEEQSRIKDKICVGKAALIDYRDNYIYALFDVCALSSFRTAAIACLAFSLAEKNADTITVAGCGRIGFYTATILHRWFHINSLRIHDPDRKNLQRFHALCAIYLPELELCCIEEPDAVTETTAIFLSTNGPTPICNANNSKEISFISSVGADADNLSELDSDLLETHRLVTDSIQSMCLGDMQRWEQSGQLQRAMVTELKDALQQPEDSEKMLFISTGVALQDALACRFIYDKLAKK